MSEGKKKSSLRSAATQARAAKVARNLQGANAGRAAERVEAIDEDNPEWTEEDFARARPASEILPPEIAAALVRKRGRPPKAEGERKEQVTLRLSPEVLAHFRGTGEGWQTRIDEALRKHVRG